VFGIDRYSLMQVKLTKISYIWTFFKVRIIHEYFFSGFGLDRFDCKNTTKDADYLNTRVIIHFRR
jgi:hypothetical protein